MHVQGISSRIPDGGLLGTKKQLSYISSRTFLCEYIIERILIIIRPVLLSRRYYRLASSSETTCRTIAN